MYFVLKLSRHRGRAKEGFLFIIFLIREKGWGGAEGVGVLR